MRSLLCKLLRHRPPFDYRLRGRTYQCTRCHQTVRWGLR